MRALQTLLSFWIYSFPIILSSQPYEQIWQCTYQELPNLTITNVFQAFDGKLIAIGAIALSAKASQGVFLVIDESNGKIIRQSSLSRKQQNILNTALQADDGTFYLAGSAGNSYEDHRPWLIRITEQGRILTDTLLTNASSNTFEQIAVFDDGTLLLAGQEYRGQNSKVCVMKWQRGKIIQSNSEPNKNSRKLLGLMIDKLGQVHLCSGIEKQGVAWYTLFDKELKFVSSCSFDKVSQTELEKVDFLSDNSLYFFGNTWRKGNADVWLSYANTDTGYIKENTSNSPLEATRNPEYLQAVTKLPDGKYVLSISTFPKGSTTEELVNQLYLVDIGAPNSNNIIFPIGSEQKQVVTSLHTGFRKNLWVITIAEKSKQSYAQLTCLRPDDSVVAKGLQGGYKIECSTPELIDEDGDGKLAPGERGGIVFWAKNIGDIDIYEGEVQISPIEVVTGLNIPAKKGFVSAIMRGERMKISIPVEGADNLAGGTSRFEVTLKVNGSVIKKLEAQVRSAKSGGPEKKLRVQPTGQETDTRRVRSSTTEYSITGRIGNNEQIPNKNFRTYVNNVQQGDANKAAQPEFRTLIESDGYEHIVTYKVQLQEGENIVQMTVIIDGVEYKSEPLYIDYQPRKPNLHLIAIAPFYNDLKYNRKDAEDIIAILEKQKELGIYNDVIIYPLTTPKKTSKTEVQIAFKELVKQANPGSVNPVFEKDVILVFISSHGKVLNNQFKIVPSDYRDDYAEETTVDYKTDILEQLEKIHCKKLILIDACHSGLAKSKADLSDANISEALNQLNLVAEGVTTISSSQANELSYEQDVWENGAFTEALLEAFANKELTSMPKPDTNGDQFLSIEELYSFLRQRVPSLMKEIFQKNADSNPQNPFMPKNELGEGLKIFVVKN